MTTLVAHLERITARHYRVKHRRPHVRRLESRLLRRLAAITELQRLGWQRPPLSLLKHLRPLLSLAPLDAPLLTSACQELAQRNAPELVKLQQCLDAGGPAVAIISCRDRLKQGQQALEEFLGWADKGYGQPLLISGDSGLADWTFRFSPEQRWLQLPCRDSYDGLPSKMLTLMWVLCLLPRSPALLKIDDDGQPGDPDRLRTLVQRLGSGHAAAAGFPIVTQTALCLERAWHIGKSAGRVNRQPFSSLGTQCWLSGGTGYLLNSEAVRLLGHFALHSWGFVQSMIYEDVCVSMLLQAGQSKMYWLEDPRDLGVHSERQQEISAGQWQPPIELMNSLPGVHKHRTP